MRRSYMLVRGRGYILSALTAISLLTLAAAPAFADADPIENRNRDTTARTSLGAPFATQCARAAMEGRADDESLAACDRAVTGERLNRANLIATQINRGALYLRRRDGANALNAFDAVVELEPRNAEGHLNRGAALVMLGRPGPAVGAITEALTLGVSEPHKAYFNRAAAREALGDVRGAFEDYRTALEIEPDWGPANAELARFARVRRDALAQVIAEGDGDEMDGEDPGESGAP